MKMGTRKISRKYTYNSPTLNADFTPLTKMERQKFGVDYGIRVTNIKRGRVSNMGINEGTIILRFNGRTYTDAKALAADIEKARGHISIEAIGPDGGRYNYSFLGGF
jgi:S1-C subfamily serine protease